MDSDATVTPKDLITFLHTFKESMEIKIEKTREGIEEKMENTNKKIDGKLKEIDEEVKKINLKMNETEEKNEEVNAKMERRLTALELEMEKSSAIRRKSTELRMKEKQLRNTVSPPAQKETQPIAPARRIIQLEEQKEIASQGTFRSSWAQEMKMELQNAANRPVQPTGRIRNDHQVDWFTNNHQRNTVDNHEHGEAHENWEDALENVQAAPENGHAAYNQLSLYRNEQAAPENVPAAFNQLNHYRKKTTKVRTPVIIDKWFEEESSNEKSDSDLS